MNTPFSNCPIGIFDSGIGGLTVASAMRNVLPSENIIYLGDTARLPYGSKSGKLITRYSVDNAIFLISNNVKLIVIACNTASALSANYLRSFIKVPVVGVIECGALGAVRITKNKRVGVIGTKNTVNSGAYTNAINNLDPEIRVFEQSTPLLVHLVEENWIEKDITISIIRDYLQPIIENEIDTLILGCTHYPLLKERIQSITGNISLVDSSNEIAHLVLNTLKIQNLLSGSKEPGSSNIYLTDLYPEFSNRAKLFLGKETEATLIDIEKHGFC